MKNIIMIAPIHKWDDVRVFKKEAKSLANAGFKVTLYCKSKEDFISDNIEVKSINKGIRSLIERIRIQFKMLKLIRKEEYEIVHFHNPDTLIVALIAKVFLRKNVIYDTHEDFSQRIIMRLWIPKFFRYPMAKFIEGLERVACKFLDSVIVTQKNLYNKYNEKPVILLNAPIIDKEAYKISEQMSKKLVLKAAFRFIYIGGISEVRGIQEFLYCLNELVKKYPLERFEFVLIGPIEEEFLEKLKSHEAWKWVFFLGELPQEEAFSYLIKSDVGICTILDVGDHKNTSANKLYEYQRFNKPFIATDFPLWIEELEEIESGMFVNPLDSNQVISAMEELFFNKKMREFMGNNGLNYISNRFNWELEEKKLINLYKELS